ncbi:MAG: hypothetical protein ABR543_15890 [Gemmatimonadaceae bacterium]
MTHVSRASVKPRFSAWRRVAIVIAAIVQTTTLALAPFAEARAGSSPREHVEAAGTGQHRAHDIDTCISCAALITYGTVPTARSVFDPSGTNDRRPVFDDDASPPKAQLAPSLPRAPPVSA